ncbi:11758_t:CDS:2, partial [Entrophospora sp. SA101]
MDPRTPQTGIYPQQYSNADDQNNAHLQAYSSNSNPMMSIAETRSVYPVPVSSKTISKARLHSKVNGPGCAGVEKPIITRVQITEEAKRQFEIFFADKNIVNLSSYR